VRPLATSLLTISLALGGACSMNSAQPVSPDSVDSARLQVLRRAQVWSRTDVASKNMLTGPGGPGAFAPNQAVTCTYVDERLTGGTPKFRCTIGKDEFRVKYGERNGEVFGEVAASRLLWALGFPSDAQYPVRVICRGCSEDPWTKHGRAEGQHEFPFAVIERKFPAREITPDDKPGWAWPELDLVDERAGGAPRSHRDALKLLAVFMQHTDTKPEQQRIVCQDGREKDPTCRQPVMMLNDIGLTFGRANNLNSNTAGSTNLRSWEKVPVWRDPGRCVGELSKSVTGTLEHPVISEAGRQHLATLLGQLSDTQIRQLFEVSRVSQRTVEKNGVEEAAPVAEWVAAFKAKRSQIVDHRCPAAAAPFPDF
jgi:hypothetical protein